MLRSMRRRPASTEGDARLVPALQRTREPFTTRLLDGDAFARLCRAREYLVDCAAERVTLAAAAREAALSPCHFQRRFVAAFGESPTAFVTRLRIERAKRDLATTARSVTEICFDVGYESLGSFSARFRELVGVSPREYRRGARASVGGWWVWRPVFVPACFLYLLAPAGPQDRRSATAGRAPSSGVPSIERGRP
jgi:AraC-like DNA-binding protein